MTIKCIGDKILNIKINSRQHEIFKKYFLMNIRTKLSRSANISLVDQIIALIQTQIDKKILRAGMRVPSIRELATDGEVSRFTVVEAYDRLVAKGYLESRRGSGFYVRKHEPAKQNEVSQAIQSGTSFDVELMVRSMYRQYAPEKMPGLGLLPFEFLNGNLIASNLRDIGRQHANQFLQYGTLQGFLPLRQQLQLKLMNLEISATTDQIVTTTGVTQGLDLVCRLLTKPGDTVFVDDPAWYLLFGILDNLGVKIIGIPRLIDGPDINQLSEMAALHKPCLYITNSVLQNPTSSSLSSAKAFQVLKLAQEHDFMIAEDDIYCDMHPGNHIQPATRLASLDQLNRVIYLGGFSKTLAVNLRVGFIATTKLLAQKISDRKMLTSSTSCEISERVMYKILSEGRYRKHTERLRNKLAIARAKSVAWLTGLGMTINIHSAAGMFVWADTGCDAQQLAEKALKEDIFLTPGSLFSATQKVSPYMRFNVATLSDPSVIAFFEREIKHK